MTLNSSLPINNDIGQSKDEVTVQEHLFNQIKVNIQKKLQTDEFFIGMKTKSGRTQESEGYSIRGVRGVLEEMDLTFTMASSQQPIDFRNVGGIGLSIEVKKTDSNQIMLNDTVPNPDVYYIIFVAKKKDIRFLRGDQFIDDIDRQHLQELQERIIKLRVWCKSTFRKNLSFYPRKNGVFKLN
jgi:hypothetical protein